MGRFPLVHALGAAAVDDAPGVAQHDIVGRQAHRLQQLDAGDRGGAGAVDHHLDPVELAAGQVQRVDQPGRGDDRRAVLVVVEHRDVEQLAQPLLDDEALRRLDVLEIDAAEGRVQKAHAIDEFVDVAGVDLEIDRVDIGEALEQRALPSMTGLAASAPRSPSPKHRGAVRDDRDEIALRGVVEGGARAAVGCAGTGTRRPANRRATGRAASSAAWSARSTACRDARWRGTAAPRLRCARFRYPCSRVLLIRPRDSRCGPTTNVEERASSGQNHRPAARRARKALWECSWFPVPTGTAEHSA